MWRVDKFGSVFWTVSFHDLLGLKSPCKDIKNFNSSLTFLVHCYHVFKMHNIFVVEDFFMALREAMNVHMFHLLTGIMSSQNGIFSLLMQTMLKLSAE